MRSADGSMNFQRPTPRPKTILAGAILSLILHAGLIVVFRAPAAPYAAMANHPTIPSLIWIVPPKPKGAIAARAREAARSVGLQPQIATIKRAPRLPPASTNKPVAAARPEAIVIAPAALPEPETGPGAQPHLDMDAALKSARKFAGERSRKNDPAVAQLQDKPFNEPKTETSLGRNIAGASRPDCKPLASGSGILALVIVPYVVLTDKKDSGCKW